MKSVRPTLALFFLILISASCNASTDMERFLLASACEAPCWLGITPGITSEAETKQILSDASDVIDVDSIVTVVESSKQQFRWKFNNSRLSGGVIFNEGIAAQIFIRDYNPLTPRNTIALSSLIEEYGEPKEIYYSVLSGDVLLYSVILVNPEKGTAFIFTEPKEGKLSLLPETRVSWVEFFDPKQFQDWKNYFVGYEDVEKRHFEWNGYGEISVP